MENVDNTKSEVQASNQKGTFRWFLVTVNNPKQSLPEIMDKIAPTYAIGQLEKGNETGTEHYQIACYFSQACRVTKFKTIGHAIGVAAKDGPRIRNYCRKQETRLADPIEVGTYPEKGTSGSYSDALACAKEGRISDIDPEILIRNLGNLQKIAAQFTEAYEHHEVRGLWYVGPPGTGKSHKARELHPDLYIKSQNKWWDGYAGERAVLLDDLDLSGVCLGHYLKIWADRYACSGEIKGATVRLRHQVFIITSNWTISELWATMPKMCEAIERRFKVEYFTTVYQKELAEFISE